MNIQVNVRDNVLKPIDDVFDAIVNPDRITGYFASGSDRRLEEGKIVKWTFSDVGMVLEVNVTKVEQNKRISFDWVASGQLATVDINLKKEDKEKTNIVITEGLFYPDEAGIQKALQQTQGWTDFICSLKAYLYTGINLRNGHVK